MRRDQLGRERGARGRWRRRLGRKIDAGDVQLHRIPLNEDGICVVVDEIGGGVPASFDPAVSGVERERLADHV